MTSSDTSRFTKLTDDGQILTKFCSVERLFLIVNSSLIFIEICIEIKNNTDKLSIDRYLCLFKKMIMPCFRARFSAEVTAARNFVTYHTKIQEQFFFLVVF